MSDLITVAYNDRSQTAAAVVGSTAATVIKSTRGGSEPVYFSPRQSKRIIEYFGIPQSGNEAVDDILEYNSKYPIWVSAPSTGSLHAGVLVTSTELIPLTEGSADKTLDFSAVTVGALTDQTPNGVLTNFTATLPSFAFYNHQSLYLEIDGSVVELTLTDAEPEIVTTDPDIGSGTYTRATGVFDFTFTEAPASGTEIKVLGTTDRESDSYFVIFDKNPQVSDLKASVVKDGDNYKIDIQKQSYLSNTYKTVSGYPVSGSLIPNTKDGFGNNIYFPVKLKDDDYITVVVNENSTALTFTDVDTPVALAGGVRGVTEIASLTAGWDYFKNTNKYPVDIMFDTTADSTIPATFATLRNAYQKYAYGIVPLPASNVADALTAASTFVVDNKGLAFYWGRGIILNAYTGAEMASSLMGRVALRYADMYDVFNGLAPAWYNENGTHGGQLGGGILRMLYDATDDQQTQLANVRVNPIVLHPTFGCVITRERTGQSMLSDYASVGHVRLVDYIVANIVKQILPYQLYKLNDVAHRTSVKGTIENIIASPAALSLLREYKVVCDETNNTDDVLAREEFVVDVYLKFTPFSKTIHLNITNLAQGMSIDEV